MNARPKGSAALASAVRSAVTPTWPVPNRWCPASSTSEAVRSAPSQVADPHQAPGTQHAQHSEPPLAQAMTISTSPVKICAPPTSTSARPTREDQAGDDPGEAEGQGLRTGQGDVGEDRAEGDEGAAQHPEREQGDGVLPSLGDAVRLRLGGDLGRQPALDPRQHRRLRCPSAARQPPRASRPMTWTAMTFTMVAEGKIMA